MGVLGSLLVLLSATCAYITFFVILIPIELYFVYWNIANILEKNFTPVLFSIFILSIYFLYFLKTKNASKNGHGAPLKLLRHSTLYKYAAKWRPTTLHKTVDLPPNQQYIFPVHPHSTLPTFVSISMMTEGCEWNKVFPGIDRRCLAASSNFIIPIWREVYLWLGYVDASYKSAMNVLKYKRSLVILPGGEQEMILAKPGENKLILKNRHGFVRLALESGASLVPVFAFRANDCYTSIPGITKLNEFLSKKFWIVLPIVYGSYFTPWPRRIPVDVVVGEPIPITKPLKITPDLVYHYHQLYIEALTQLYEKNKHKYGSADRPLEILAAK